ncbi:MAG: hypothetical protein KF812_03595 [Fimbriimonadaceae bacterium]|nr:hypothetical protein [Fimbriimonadaceae bacterium]
MSEEDPGQVLTVPNWSFGRDRRLLAAVQELLVSAPVNLHFAESDPDHNRTVTAFSGRREDVGKALLDLCALILPAVDLNRHMGVHPRIGALDVCPFVPLWQPVSPGEAADLNLWIRGFGRTFAEQFEVPVFLYEHSETGNHASDLPSLRRLGFGGLMDQTLAPDFGPDCIHPFCGATVMGHRDFLLAVNVNLQNPDASAAQTVASVIRRKRRLGDPLFTGVRALGLALGIQGISQVSMNITKPDLIQLDPLLEWVSGECDRRGATTAFYELIGVIRDRDMEHTTRLHPHPEQIVRIETHHEV